MLVKLCMQPRTETSMLLFSIFLLFLFCSYMILISSYLVEKVDMDAKIARLEVHAIGVASQLELGPLKVIGEHNYYNAAVAALSVLGLGFGIDSKEINATIDKLRPPPHRMQFGKLKLILTSFFKEKMFVRLP